MQAEGANSPADIFLTVDAGRIWLADKDGLLQPVHSEVLDERIPAHLRHPDGHWFGFSQRARIIFYAKDRVAEPPQTYAGARRPGVEGQDLHPLVLERLQPLADERDDRQRRRGRRRRTGREGLLANLARPPEGGDTDQLRASSRAPATSRWPTPTTSPAASRPRSPGLSEGIDNIGWVFPNQETTGRPRQHRRRRASPRTRRTRTPRSPSSSTSSTPEAQAYFANQNFEYPAVADAAIGEVPASLGDVQGATR